MLSPLIVISVVGASSSMSLCKLLKISDHNRCVCDTDEGGCEMLPRDTVAADDDAFDAPPVEEAIEPWPVREEEDDDDMLLD